MATTYALGTGRRKSSVARVRVCGGDGKVIINERPMDEFFCLQQDRNSVMAAIQATELTGKIDVYVNVSGGGTTGQAGAVKLGVSRAIKQYDVETEQVLREKHLLTRDSRMKERKKCGLHGARRGTQFSKR